MKAMFTRAGSSRRELVVELSRDPSTQKPFLCPPVPPFFPTLY